MNLLMPRQARTLWSAVALFAALVATPVTLRAQQAQTVGGMRIHIGVVTAAWAKHFPEESAAHPDLGKSSHDHHLIVSLTDVKTGTHVTDAEVRATIRGPGWHVEKKRLVPRVTSGFPDYSETFDMHKPGRYRITVYVTTKAHPQPLVARFKWRNSAH